MKEAAGDPAATTRSRREYDKGKKKYQMLLKKQENLLRGKGFICAAVAIQAYSIIRRREPKYS